MPETSPPYTTGDSGDEQSPPDPPPIAPREIERGAVYTNHTGVHDPQPQPNLGPAAARAILRLTQELDAAEAEIADWRAADAARRGAWGALADKESRFRALCHSFHGAGLEYPHQAAIVAECLADAAARGNPAG